MLKIRSLKRGEKQIFCFSILVWVFVAFYFIISWITRNENVSAYFVFDHGDTSMDYFNMLANIKYGDPYYNQANYPALCFLIWRILYRFIPVSDRDMLNSGYEFRANMAAQIIYIIFVGVCLFLIWELIKYMSQGTTCTKNLFASSLMICGPMLFLLERGNILLLALACLLGFLALYDSEKKCLRIIAYICLAIAAGIKIYPAVFGILVLQKKRYKETFFLVVLGIAFFTIPFFFFNGIDSIKAMIKGFSAANDAQLGFGWGNNFSFDNLIKISAAFLGKNILNLPKWIAIVAGLVCLGIFVQNVKRDEWKRLFALSLFCIWLPSFSYTYTLVLLFLPIISFFFRDRTNGPFDKFYLLLWVLMIVPYCLPFSAKLNSVTGLGEIVFPIFRYPLAWGTVIANYAIVAMVVLILVEPWFLKQMTIDKEKRDTVIGEKK